MGYSENFNSGAGDFNLIQDAFFDNANGFPSGCIRFDHVFPAGGGSITNGIVSEVVAAGDKLTFYYRAIVDTLGVIDQMITAQITFQEGGGMTDIINQPASTGDAGWQPYSLTIPAEHDGKTVNYLQINDLNTWLGQGTIYIDTIFLGTVVTPTSQGRLWIYKTTDRGKTWASRGVTTAD
jgi:hypothetical protein